MTAVTDHNPNTGILYLSAGRREFGEYADRYVKGDKADIPLTPEQIRAIESPAVLPRLYRHLVGVRDSIEIQVRADAVELELIPDDPEARATLLKASRGRLRFATGLNSALSHVAWLHQKEYGGVGIDTEYTRVVLLLEKVRDALDKHRRDGLNDEEGTLEREEVLWKSVSDLIGATPEED